MFKKGDRVIVSGENIDGQSFLNESGTIVGKTSSGILYLVEFDRPRDSLHNGYPNLTSDPLLLEGKPGHCWYVERKFITLQQSQNKSKEEISPRAWDKWLL